MSLGLREALVVGIKVSLKTIRNRQLEIKFGIELFAKMMQDK